MHVPLSKMQRRLLVFEEELRFNQRIGVPVEIFCTFREETVAFGQIRALSKYHVTISRTAYLRKNYTVFGVCPAAYSFA